ncbi:MAG TPA: ATP-grasp fold amidoligase family protein [Steroidobacteraceae bacterium]
MLRRFLAALYWAFMRSLPHNRFGDRLFSCVRFATFQKRLPKNAPIYNDVIYRIKTSNEILDPLRVFVTDKEFVKLFVKAIVGDRYNIPTIAVLRSVEEVDRFEFPPDCCIKPTHASGRVIFRRNGEPVDREKIKSWFGVNYYLSGREANYKNLRPKVIVEPLLFGRTNVEDYKIFCVDGVPKLIQVDVDRHIEHKRKYFDAHWNEQPFSIKYPRTDKIVPKPHNLSEMLEVAARLSKYFWFVRIDLYSDGRQLFVGEITHCPDNAGGIFQPPAAEAIVSHYLFSGCSAERAIGWRL